ncbi:ATP-binding cassette transporter snq2 [Puccinia graminis f. sp. tritici]|uniref:ATP-binding cassette transporter snq2 n=1 Tax=Puccinia graminis f. sp. tritici TaxID=56615 RepID=A0A5B0SHX1_PUCGR|nr:ATP-binding cassette transporter snq2 [Puccinia graminis f. sp. tritici]KAA1136793.1 ATP-binding cassette transporter snq2 [Puccinia graminis f. sp. tritici]
MVDFLCSLTNPLTAKARSEAAHEVPQTPAEFIAAFRCSKHFFNLNLEMIQYDSSYPLSGAAQHIIYLVPAEKDSFVRARLPWSWTSSTSKRAGICGYPCRYLPAPADVDA